MLPTLFHAFGCWQSHCGLHESGHRRSRIWGKSLTTYVGIWYILGGGKWPTHFIIPSAYPKKEAGRCEILDLLHEILLFHFQALKSLPWDKVDIKVFSLEIQTSKLRDEADGDHKNNFDEIDALLTSVGYTLVRADWHGSDHKSLEAYYVKNEMAQNIDKKYWSSKE